MFSLFVRLLKAQALTGTSLVDIAGAGQFPFDPCPQSSEVCVVTVHNKTMFDQRPGLSELLLPIVLQCPPQEALSQTQPPQAGVYTLKGLVPVELKCSSEVL